MIPLEYTITLSMAIVEVIKKRLPERFKDLNPFLAISISVGCNLLNALIFGGDLLVAGREAFVASGVALSIFTGGYALGKALKKEE